MSERSTAPGTRIRAVLASNGATLVGGAEQSLLELAIALKQDGRVDPVVTVPAVDDILVPFGVGGENGALAVALRAESIQTFVLPTPRWSGSFRRPIPGFQGTRRMLAVGLRTRPWIHWLRAERPDVVVTNTATSPTPALASALAGIPHVWWLHEFETKDHEHLYALGEPLSQRTIGWLSRVVVANSHAVEEHFSPPIRREKMRVIHYGFPAVDAIPNRINLPQLRVLLLGRQTRTKGQRLAIEATGILSAGPLEVHLRLVGPIGDAFRAELEELATGLGISDRVEIRDFTPTPQNEFAWANVVLMCSDNEAFGRVTVEALQRGRPVIGTRSGGTIELISDGVDGLLFEPRSPRDLARSLERIASEPGLLAQMSHNAIESTRDRFTVELQVDAFVDTLTSATVRQKSA